VCVIEVEVVAVVDGEGGWEARISATVDAKVRTRSVSVREWLRWSHHFPPLSMPRFG
jgi:hypothetical protein